MRGRRCEVAGGPSRHAVAICFKDVNAPERLPRRGKSAADARADGPALLGQLATGVILPLSRALALLEGLARRSDTAPALDRAELSQLVHEIECARRVSLAGQQIARLAAGQVHAQPERFDLEQLIRQVLGQRGARGHSAAPIHARLQAAQMEGDLSLVAALLDAMFDWCDERAGGHPIALRLIEDTGVVTLQASLTQPGPPSDETLSWQRIDFAARALGVQTHLSACDAGCVLSLSFARGIDHEASAHELISGAHVLVVAKSRDLRNQVRLALRGLDLMVDFVTSVDAAREFCADASPQAVLYEASLNGPQLEQWRGTGDHGPAFIEIAGEPVAHRPRLDIDSLLHNLPDALAVEISARRC